MCFHASFKARGIDFESAFTSEEFGEVERKTVGVVEREGFLAADGAVLALLFKELESAIEGFIKTAFFVCEGLFDSGGARFDFRENRAKLCNQGID